MTSIYSKCSFDRFGDDLMEVLLSYIAFEHCFRFRCVSKQWKRLICNKQMYFIINHIFDSKNRCLCDPIYLRRIELIVKNCPNITSIDFSSYRLFDEVFKLITKYCNNLYEVKFNMWGLYDLPESIKNEFILKISNLKKITIYSVY